MKEARVASEPEAIIAWFEGLNLEMAAIGLKAGPLSQWLYAAMIEAKFPVVLLETRQVRDAFRSMPVKTDPKNARGIAQLMRLGNAAGFIASHRKRRRTGRSLLAARCCSRSTSILSCACADCCVVMA
ncbi:IS110 family transposase [Novosphingobium sp. 1949]|uniref:IS110 family transposase n=1 Tax=Novosphingobium organovorum TaxID=2930092 RepID=A0ABT0BFH6_9SPHN|nr:IS110 family transposase [Novosphingobium organovorum]